MGMLPKSYPPSTDTHLTQRKSQVPPGPPKPASMTWPLLSDLVSSTGPPTHSAPASRASGMFPEDRDTHSHLRYSTCCSFCSEHPSLSHLHGLLSPLLRAFTQRLRSPRGRPMRNCNIPTIILFCFVSLHPAVTCRCRFPARILSSV